MQITSGTVTILAASPDTVQGDINVDWSQVTVNSLFICDEQSFRINSVDAGAKVITLDGNFTTSVDVVGASYIIVRDFTPNFNLPLLNSGDLEASIIFSRAMRIIDGMLGATGSVASTEITGTKTAHGFIVGNFIRMNGSTFSLANSNSLADSMTIGAVTSVVDANTFKFVTQGKVTSVAGISMTPGTVYYLRQTPVSGGGGQVNIVDNSGGAWTHVGGLRIPVLVADTATSGFVLSLATAASGVFSTVAAGLVPQSPGGTTAYLRADGAWAANALANGSVNVQHLAAGGTVDWALFNAQSSPLSIHAHMLDLNSRLVTTTSATAKVPMRATLGIGGGSWVVPEGVSSVRITLDYGSSNMEYVTIPPAMRSSGYTYVHGSYASRASFTLNVVPGQVISLEVTTTNAPANTAFGASEPAYAPTSISTRLTGAYWRGLVLVLKQGSNQIVRLGPSTPGGSSWESFWIPGKRYCQGLRPLVSMSQTSSLALNLTGYYYARMLNGLASGSDPYNTVGWAKPVEEYYAFIAPLVSADYSPFHESGYSFQSRRGVSIGNLDDVCLIEWLG